LMNKFPYAFKLFLSHQWEHWIFVHLCTTID
jgi:hypothetical protein